MKVKIVSTVISLVMILSVFAMTIPVTPVSAGAITINPATGTVGSITTITATALGAATQATITYDGIAIASNVPIAGGTFTRSLAIPISAKGAHTITVTTDLPETISGSFTVIPSITLGNTAGPVGSQVMISGTGYTANVLFAVTFGVTALTATTGYASSTGSFSGQFTVPDYPAGLYNVTGATLFETSSTTFAVTSNMNLSSTSGNVGSLVTLTGKGFMASGLTYIYFNDALLINSNTTTSGSIDSVGITIPESVAGNHIIRILDTQGNTNNAVFTINPRITVSPASLAPGDQFSFSGTGFSALSPITVTLNTTPVSVITSTNSKGTITNTIVKLPVTPAGTHTLTVSDAAGKTATAAISSVSLLSVTPTSGAVGSKAELTGIGFKSNANVFITFNGKLINTNPAILTDALGNFKTTFTIPEAASAIHTIVASDGTGTASTKLSTFPIAAPISINTGMVGSDIPISGSGFNASSAITIKFDSFSIGTAKADENGSFSYALKIPSTTVGDHEVIATDGVNQISFKVRVTPTPRPAPEVVAPGVTTGYIGTDIKLSGTYFTAGATLSVLFDNAVIASVPIDNNGSFSTSVKIPTAKSGNHTITVTDGTTTKTYNFTIDASVPKAPEANSPTEGIRLMQPVTFQWSQVSSQNGPVTYQFQLSQDPGFASVIIDRKTLSAPALTLADQEKLKSVKKTNPYYWRVRATDAAGDTGDWSIASAFTVGTVVPSWLTYLMIGIGGLLLFGIGFLAGRKTLGFGINR